MAKAKTGGTWEKRHRAFNQAIVERIARDAKFRKALLTDADAALREAGLADDLRQLEERERDPGITLKQCAPLSCVKTCTLTCKSDTCLHTTTC